MEKELLKCLIDFSSKLENTDMKWKELAKSSERTIEALANQAEQLRHVTSKEVDNAELCKVEGLRDRLIFKIYAGIEDEVAQLQAAVSRLNNSSQDLRNRLIKIENVCNNLSFEDENMKELVKGTAYRSKLNLLLEWAIDACDYYHNLYCRINENLKALNYKDEASIQNLAKSFVEVEFKRMKIDHILLHTQFLAKETCR